MGFLELVKSYGTIVGPLSIAGGLASASLAWLTILTNQDHMRIAVQVGQQLMFLAILLPIVALVMLYRWRDDLAQTPRNQLAPAFALIGAGGGLFCIFIYYYINLQVPVIFKGVDVATHTQTLVPEMGPGALMTIITTTVAMIAGAMLFGEKS